MTFDSSLFAHRLNEDGSYDSICRVCFAAVVRSKPESELAQYEETHDCQPDFLEERENEPAGISRSSSYP